MRRIIIIGCGGSGKSTLAAKLGELLQLPVVHLDRLFWRPGWQESSKAEMDAKVEALCGGDAWIIDGNYGRTLDVRIAACDTIIFLDLSTLSCLWGVVRRYWRYRGRTRPDMGEGCTEQISWEFIKWIWRYRRDSRPDVLRKLNAAGPGRSVIILKSRRRVSDFLREQHAISANPCPSTQNEAIHG